MTIKDQITRLLNKAQYPMTNREIARKIKRPEPSVRRATLALETDFQLRAFAVDTNRQISWAAR